MLRITIPILKVFVFFIVGIFLAFPVSAMCGAIAIFLTYLPIIWEILWRTGLGLMMMTAIALFFESIKRQKQLNLKTTYRLDFGSHPNSDNREYREMLATLPSPMEVLAHRQQSFHNLHHYCDNGIS